MSDTLTPRVRLRLALLMLLLLITSLGCSLGEILLGAPTPIPTPTALPPLPTWTPTVTGALSPAQAATMTVAAGIALAFPSLTPTPTPFYTPTPTPTWTPEPTPVDTPTATPAPLLLINAPVVNVRSGPSIAYAIIGQANQNEQYTVQGRNEAMTWWQICCINGQPGWITMQLTSFTGAADAVAVVANPDLPPTPVPVDTPIPVPTAAPTATPAPVRPLWLAEGPELWETTNPWLTIWLKVFVGQAAISLPVPNLRLRVLRDGVDVSRPFLTDDVFQYSAPTALGTPIGNRRLYNLKYEYMPAAGNAEWTIIVTDANGNPLSVPVSFRTRGGQEIYVSYFDGR